MTTFLFLFIGASLASLAFTPIVRRVCERRGWVDEPRGARRLHTKAVPRLGGVAIYLSVVATLSAVWGASFLFFGRDAAAPFSHLLTTLIPASVVFAFGIYDDLRESSAAMKFAAQGLAGIALYVMGGRIDVLSVPFVGSVQIPLALSFLLTVCWVVVISNAFNLIDGMDGLAAGSALFSTLVMAVVSLTSGHVAVSVIAFTLAGALIGFLRYNFNPASIFLGDSGSLFVGFTLAAISVQQPQKSSTAVAVAIPMMAFGLPIVDTTMAVVRRFLSGKPLFEGDREHVHHMLLSRGWSQRRVALVLYGVCAAFGLVALLCASESARTTGLVLLVVAAAVAIALGRLRYHEVEELSDSVRRNLTQGRARLANNIRVRRASRALSQAATLDEMFAAVQEVLECSEFVLAAVQVGRGGDSAGNRQAWERERMALTRRRAEFRGGLICWSWGRDDVDSSDVFGSARYWSLRLPLSDDLHGLGYLNLYREFDSDHVQLNINYLCNIFQHELTRAASRVLACGEYEAEGKRAFAGSAV
ncbi:MAG: undecaprenyl/decaprenyl-phosphate alpha-N-acetylglucosaminyl 1-phosphate transferase [Acidobacteriota bacterium]|nr:undecaprenyl/decaprenyl-phosphate alpha-N-acetylglucosaminyl 1-phosphate transferase [Acidobacteriota bacterium]